MKKLLIFPAVLLASLDGSRAWGAFPPASPASVTQSWQQLPMPPQVAHDKVRDIKFSPSGDLYVSFDAEGLWRSGDFGKTWENIRYNLPSVGGMLNFNQQGEILFAPSSVEHRGIYRLPKGEVLWIPAKVDTTGMGGSHFPNRLILNKSGDVICATSATQILRSTDGGKTFQHTGNRLAGAALFDMTRNPTNPNELAIGTETGPTWRSTDGGLNWTDIGKPGGGGNIRLLYNRQGGLFGSATHSALRLGWTLACWTEGNMWVRSDGGLPVGEDTRSSALSGSGWMFLGNSNVYVSKDDGQTWQLVGAEFPSMAGVRVHVRCLAVGTDGYLYAGVANSGARLPMCGIWRLSIGDR